MTLPAVGYIRVSTEEQAAEGVSLEDQQTRITHYALAQSPPLDLIHVYVDQVTSEVPLARRPGGKLLIRELAKGPRAILILKLDRCWRNARETLETVEGWDLQGHKLHVLDLGGASMNLTEGIGKFFLTMAAAFAELERFRIRERTRDALARLKAKGVHLGGVPYGKRKVKGVVEDDPDEQAVIREGKRLHARGKTPSEIAYLLNTQGRTTRMGKLWDAHSVRRTLLRLEKKDS